MSNDTQAAMAYPTEKQYNRWKSRANELDMSVSEFMTSMIEAGMKKFDETVELDEDARQLREQRNDLRDELQRARNRIEKLEQRLYQGERAAINAYVEENPGADYEEIIQHIIDTVPERVTMHLDELEGESLFLVKGQYYPEDKRGGIEES